MDAYRRVVESYIDNTHFTNAYYRPEKNIIFFYVRNTNVLPIGMDWWCVFDFAGNRKRLTKEFAEELFEFCPQFPLHEIPEHLMSQEMILAKKLL